MSRLFAFSDENRVSKNVIEQGGITSVSHVQETYDGGLLIAGNITDYGGVVGRNKLIKVTQDGIVDNEFSSNASDGAKFNSSISVLKELSDNSILIGGSFTNYAGIANLNYFIKLNSDGTLNNSFIANACGQNKFNSIVYSVEEQPDGKILVGGTFTNYGGRYGRNSVIRLNSNGTLDPTFNCAVDDPLVSDTSFPVISTSGSAIATLGSGISAISAVGTTTTITTSVNHNFVANESVVISGVTQSGGTTINGTKTIVSVTTNQIVISTPTTPTGIGFSSGLVKKTNFNNVSIGSTVSSSPSILPTSYIKDLYVDSTGDRKIVFANNATSSGTTRVSQSGRYRFEVGTTLGLQTVTAKYQRFFNSRIKTIAGDSYIYFPLEDDNDTDPSRYFGPKKVFCSAFPNGKILTYSDDQWGTGYIGIETIDNVKYHKFQQSGATTTSEEFCLISQAETWTAISGNKLQIGESGFDIRPYADYLRIGQPIYTENGSTSGPWGAGVSTATITAIENTQISLPGFPYVATVINIQTSPAVTSTSGNFALNFGQYSIPYTTKVNELFTPSANFTSTATDFYLAEKRITVSSITSGNTSSFVSGQVATTTGTTTLTSSKKFFNNVLNIKYSQIDNSIIFGGGFFYDNLLNRTDLIKLSESGLINRNFFNTIPDIDDSFAFETISYISSIDVDNNGNVYIAGDLKITDITASSIITGLIKLNYLGSLDNTFLSNVGNKFGDSTTGNPTNSKGAVSFVSIQKNGYEPSYKILASGCFKTTGYDNVSGRNYMVRLNENGTIDSDFCTQLIDNKLGEGFNPALGSDKKEIAKGLASKLSNNIYIFGIVNNTNFKPYNEYDLVLNKV